MNLTGPLHSCRKIAKNIAIVFGIFFWPVSAGSQDITSHDVSATASENVANRNKLFISLKTNMLYDAAAIPNIGAEVYIGRNISVAAQWNYAWWSCESRHRYWRIYGGDVVARYWFGNAAKIKPLTGHHVGIYAGALTFDVEWGGKAYMGGRPGGTLWDRCMINAGVEYGYSLPVTRRLNIDFTIGLGYFGGIVEKFTPTDGYYLWESTTRQTWIGPTKAEISLVWLIGRDNFNAKKGGDR
ncbi:MAG: DUF3575 domain-containing protein [Barnesiella sp.]|nr:DUF3575 domain-containing protein [Barnesiella sp.]MBD5257635.1 DUF3575 domain-containing protein [Barnesiella sp.]